MKIILILGFIRLPPLSEYKNLIKRRSSIANEPQYQNQRGAEGYLRQEAARRQEGLRNHDHVGELEGHRLKVFQYVEYDSHFLTWDLFS